MDIAPARRVSIPAWINAQTVLGLAIFALSLVAGQAAMRASGSTVPVWSAARDLPSGSVLGTDDLVAADVQLSASTSQNYFDSAQDLIGMVLTESIASGELIPSSRVVSAVTPRSAIAIPITADHAAGGHLAPGDIVQVYATFRSSQANARTVFVIQAEVLAVASQAGITGGSSLSGVTIAIPPAEAARVAFVIRTADIDLVRVDANIDEHPEEVGTKDFDR